MHLFGHCSRNRCSCSNFHQKPTLCGSVKASRRNMRFDVAITQKFPKCRKIVSSMTKFRRGQESARLPCKNANLAHCTYSGKKKEPKPKLFGPDIFGWGGGLPHERGGGGAKSSVCPSKPGETKLFGGISRDFCRDMPGVPEKFEKVKVVFNSRPLPMSRIM